MRQRYEGISTYSNGWRLFYSIGAVFPLTPEQKTNVNHILSHCFPKEKGEIKNVTNSRLKVTKNVT
jgi:hypothetical protein